MDTDGPEHYYLEPGFIYCAPGPAVIHAVTGTSVCVCVWDRRLGRGAMNHFQFPEIRDPKRATALYGNVATARLIQLMLEAGSRKSDLAAQIFGGGAHRDHGDPELGAQNQAIAKEVLRRKCIPVLSEDIGGAMGRKIAFDTLTGHAIVLKVHDLRASDWGAR